MRGQSDSGNIAAAHTDTEGISRQPIVSGATEAIMIIVSISISSSSECAHAGGGAVGER